MLRSIALPSTSAARTDVEGWDVRSSGFGPAALKELGLEEQWATDAGF